MPFLTDLVVRQAGEHRWALVKSLEYRAAREEFCVPSSFVTDFASVPRLLWWLVPPYGRYTKAAVLHDWLYFAKEVSRSDADGIFRRVMREQGTNLLLRWTMFLAVRIFGWWAWRSTRQ